MTNDAYGSEITALTFIVFVFVDVGQNERGGPRQDSSLQAFLIRDPPPQQPSALISKIRPPSQDM